MAVVSLNNILFCFMYNSSMMWWFSPVPFVSVEDVKAPQKVVRFISCPSLVKNRSRLSFGVLWKNRFRRINNWCYRAISVCAFSSQSSYRSLSRRSHTWRASCRCACACETWGYRSDGRLCYRLNTCTVSRHCGSVCDSCNSLKRKKNVYIKRIMTGVFPQQVNSSQLSYI